MRTSISETMEEKWRVAARARRRDGMGAVIRLVGRSAADHLMHPSVRRRHADFDRRHGVDTSGLTAASNLDHTGGRHGDGVNYGTVPIHQTKSMFRALAALGARPLSDFTFIDLGCGKGLPVMLAALHGFGAVIGVELDSGLAATARRNASALAAGGHGRGAIEVLTQDAAEFDFPERPTAVFLFNPFGAATLGTVMNRVVESVKRCPRSFFVAYYNPVHREVIDGRPELKPIWRTVRWSLYSAEVHT